MNSFNCKIYPITITYKTLISTLYKHERLVEISKGIQHRTFTAVERIATRVESGNLIIIINDITWTISSASFECACWR